MYPAATPETSYGQLPTDEIYGLTESGAANPLALLRQRLASGVSSGLVTPMEGPVDPDTYFVGPGDMFSVSVAGQDVTPAPVRVGADGRLSLPGAGTAMVGGISLAEARVRILDVLNNAYRNTDVDVSLAQPRQFYVHVSGAVPTPGRFLALPVSRVSSILELAFSDTTRSPVANADFRPALRNIRLIHTDGTEETVDLLRYFSSGDRESNPFLRDGDVIFVPTFNPDFSSVYVGGAVPFPGPYDFRPGDTVGDLIEVAGGLPAEYPIESIRLTRRTEAGFEETVFTEEDARSGVLDDVMLHRRDQVSIQSPDALLGSSEVVGMFKYPGSYPITDGVTTVSDLIEAAGGLREDALIRGAYVERHSLPDPQLRMRRNRFDADLSSLQSALASDTTAIMQSLRMTNLDFLSRAYFAQETRLQNRVAVDLAAVLSGTADPVVLRTGDRIVVPRDNRSVYVIGQVNRPGFVELVDDRTIDYYIEMAGGRGQFADEVYIMHPASGTFSPPGERPLQSGDVIFVDRAVDVADNAELQRLVLEESRARQDARIRTTQAVAQAISTIATVVALIVTIRNR